MRVLARVTVFPCTPASDSFPLPKQRWYSAYEIQARKRKFAVRTLKPVLGVLIAALCVTSTSGAIAGAAPSKSPSAHTLQAPKAPSTVTDCDGESVQLPEN